MHLKAPAAHGRPCRDTPDTLGAIVPQMEPVTLRGVIIPVEWDEDGNHSAIALAADDEGIYRISPGNRTGRMLTELLRRRVMIKGWQVNEKEAAVPAIFKVTAYRVLEDNRL